MKDHAFIAAQDEAVEYFYNHETRRQLMQDAHKVQGEEVARLLGLAIAAVGRLARRIGAYFAEVTESFSRAAYYRDLTGMSDRELSDLGIDRGEIQYLVDRCFNKPALAANDMHGRTDLAA